MNIFLLASVITFAAIIALNVKKQKKLLHNQEQSFWARERAANSVRKKPLDNLNYIHVPLDKLPWEALAEDSKVAEYQTLVKDLSELPIVNLTGYTNTDLKLEYGTANITVLTEYDQSYTVLVRTLQQWADILLEANYVSEAKDLMEFAISTGTDISRTYYKLADIYASRGEFSQVEQLITQAENLRSSTKNIIVRTLRESYP